MRFHSVILARFVLMYCCDMADAEFLHTTAGSFRPIANGVLLFSSRFCAAFLLRRQYRRRTVLPPAGRFQQLTMLG